MTRAAVFYIITVCLLLSNTSNAQFAPVPDANFRNWLNTNYPGIIVGGQLDLSYFGLSTIDHIDCSFNNPPIVDLEGIQHFSALYELNCEGNQINNIPALPVGTTVLKFKNNQLSNLSPFPDSTRYIDVSQNLFAGSFMSIPNKVNYFDCSDQAISSLPVLPSVVVQFFDCSNNNITSLPAVIPTVTDYFNCSGNLLTSLPPLPLDMAGTFLCTDNNIGSIAQIPPLIKDFRCDNNPLTELPPLPPVLEKLYCSFGQIQGLPNLPGTLSDLRCRNNPINCLPPLPVGLTNLDHTSTNISCLPNFPPNLTTSLNTLCPFLGPCSSAINSGGVLFKDENNSGNWDSTEIKINDIQVTVNPGNILVNATNGMWKYRLDTGQIYTCHGSSNSPYYTVVPDSHIVQYSTISDADSTLHFGLQSAGLFNDLSITTALSTPAIPGFNCRYALSCKNRGTTNLSARVSFAFDDQLLSYVSSSIAYDSIYGNVIEYDLGTIAALEKKYFSIDFKLDSTVQIGTTFMGMAAITSDSLDETPINNYDTTFATVVGAYDPNEKTVSKESVNVNEVLSEKRINYTIRFQNTGNNPAGRVRISDLLSPKLKPESFEYISSSHSCNIYRDANQLWIDYNNINLPDSTSSEPESHGFFKFSIKIDQALTPGDSISNFADIYFDYNSLIRTNTAVTNYNITTEALDHRQEQFRLYPNPASTILCVNRDEGKLFDSYCIYNSMGQVVRELNLAISLSQTIIDIVDLKKGIYFIKLNANGEVYCKPFVKASDN